MQLYKRKWSLVVGDPTSNPIASRFHMDGLDLSDLSFSFSVKKTLKVTPNTCDLVIYNLSNDSRKRLETPKTLTVKLEAGYEENVSLIYLGEIRAAVSTTDGPETVTKISSGDGETEIQTSRINVSIPPKASITDVLKILVKALNVQPGNVNWLIDKLKAKGIDLTSMFATGTVLSGSAADELTSLCKSADLEWSIQDGQMQLLEHAQPLSDTAFLLSATTGMIGAPEVDAQGIVTCTALMIPELAPGKKVVFDANHLKGGYRVTQAEYVGENFANDWYVHLCLRALS